jgi:hypothetical protein
MPRCQCYQIGGPFIAEDPECPVHGIAAQTECARRSAIAVKLRQVLQDYTLDTAARQSLNEAISALEG